MADEQNTKKESQTAEDKTQTIEGELQVIKTELQVIKADMQVVKLVEPPAKTKLHEDTVKSEKPWANAETMWFHYSMEEAKLTKVREYEGKHEPHIPVNFHEPASVVKESSFKRLYHWIVGDDFLTLTNHTDRGIAVVIERDEGAVRPVSLISCLSSFRLERRTKRMHFRLVLP